MTRKYRYSHLVYIHRHNSFSVGLCIIRQRYHAGCISFSSTEKYVEVEY